MTEPATAAVRWLPAARAGSSEALGQLLEACRGYLLLIAQERLAPELRAKGGASDLVQQTFLDAQRDFTCFRGDTEAELLAWLRRLLLNNLTDFARGFAADKRDVRREVALAAGDSSADEGGGLAADTPTPSGEAIGRERAEAVQRALDRLPENYRRVLGLRYQQGCSFEEIGRQLGLTANAARKLLLRAVERVQQELDEPP
jgi:RNA polymerase sigma-70 factor (ECF subfamily)